MKGEGGDLTTKDKQKIERELEREAPLRRIWSYISCWCAPSVF